MQILIFISKIVMYKLCYYMFDTVLLQDYILTIFYPIRKREQPCTPNEKRF